MEQHGVCSGVDCFSEVGPKDELLCLPVHLHSPGHQLRVVTVNHKGLALGNLGVLRRTDGGLNLCCFKDLHQQQRRRDTEFPKVPEI